MNDLVFLFAAFALLWTGTLAYLLRLAGLRNRLQERISRLEERTTDREPGDA